MSFVESFQMRRANSLLCGITMGGVYVGTPNR